MTAAAAGFRSARAFWSQSWVAHSAANSRVPSGRVRKVRTPTVMVPLLSARADPLRQYTSPGVSTADSGRPQRQGMWALYNMSVMVAGSLVGASETCAKNRSRLNSNGVEAIVADGGRWTRNFAKPFSVVTRCREGEDEWIGRTGAPLWCSRSWDKLLSACRLVSGTVVLSTVARHAFLVAERLTTALQETAAFTLSFPTTVDPTAGPATTGAAKRAKAVAAGAAATASAWVDEGASAETTVTAGTAATVGTERAEAGTAGAAGTAGPGAAERAGVGDPTGPAGSARRGATEAAEVGFTT